MEKITKEQIKERAKRRKEKLEQKMRDFIFINYPNPDVSKYDQGDLFLE